MTIEEFLKGYGIEIKNRRFYDEALTHNSYSHEQKLTYSYQRMEFLGDAIIQMYSSLLLFQNYQNLKEGSLTKMRSNLVREESFSYIAKKINLGPLIRFGQGEIKSRGFEKDSILADVYEALTAAIYLDQGEKTMKLWLEKTLFKFIDSNDFKDIGRDYKSELQELLQAENRHNLKYVIENQKFLEETNQFVYTIAVTLGGQTFGRGTGFSKQEAEKSAAKDCLSKMVVSK